MPEKDNFEQPIGKDHPLVVAAIEAYRPESRSLHPSSQSSRSREDRMPEEELARFFENLSLDIYAKRK